MRQSATVHRRGAKTLVVVAATAFATAATGSAGAAPRIDHGPILRFDPNVSTNWSGYVAASTDPTAAPATFTSVSARWVQPRAACVRGKPTFSAFWIGLGGASESSEALEQIGTSADCTAVGKARYSMWYELVPAASVPIKYRVFPGNVLTASVAVSGPRVTVQIRNLTRRTRFTKVLSMSSPDTSSAEWVAEAPSTCFSGGGCVVLKLSNFGSVSFTRAATVANEHPGSINDPAWTATPITLITESELESNSAPGAIPSELSPDGTAFRIDYQDAVPAPQG